MMPLVAVLVTAFLKTQNCFFLVSRLFLQTHCFLPCTPVFCWWACVMLLGHGGHSCVQEILKQGFLSGCSFISWTCDPNCFSVYSLNWDSCTVGMLLCSNLCSKLGHSAVKSAVNPAVYQSSEMSLSWILEFGAEVSPCPFACVSLKWHTCLCEHRHWHPQLVIQSQNSLFNSDCIW